MRIAVCDDEAVMRKKLVGYLEKISESIPIEVEEFEDGKQLLDRIFGQGVRFDILLLDIRMKGLDGLDTAKMIRKEDKEVVIIFITSLINYVFMGYEVKAFRYLMKPLKEKDFLEVMNAAIREIQEKKDGFLIINQKGKMGAVPIEDITYIEIHIRKVSIYTETECYECYGKISEMEQKLSEHCFIKVHRSYVVNAAHMVTVDKQNCLVGISGGKKIPMSRNRIKEVYTELTAYALENGR